MEAEYLSMTQNHGIAEDLITSLHDMARQFFTLSQKQKMDYYIGRSRVAFHISPLSDNILILDLEISRFHATLLREAN